MTTTMTNGRARKSLADQLDRLDLILTGLADALNEAVAQAVKDAVKAAVAETLAHPDGAPRLTAPATPSRPSARGRLVARARQVAGKVVARIAGFARSMVAAVQQIAIDVHNRLCRVALAAKGWPLLA